MIGTVSCAAGEHVTLSGYANDFDKSIRAVQFSLDDGAHWTTHETAGTTADRNLYWTFTYTPELPGRYDLLIRSVNEDGNASPTPAHVIIVAS